MSQFCPRAGSVPRLMGPRRGPAVVAAVVLTAALALPAGASARQVYCSPTGDYCISAGLRDGARTFFLGTLSFRGHVSICVDPPRGRSTCVRKPLVYDGTIYVAEATWRRSFPNRGRGVYRVRFYGSGRLRIGPLLSFRV